MPTVLPLPVPTYSVALPFGYYQATEHQQPVLKEVV